MAFGKGEWFWKEAEDLVNISFNRTIYEVNKRREIVLTNLRDVRNILEKLRKSIKQLEDQLNGVEDGITENFLHTSKEKKINELKDEISDLHSQACFADFDYQFVFDDTELKRALSSLGAFEKYPIHYSSKEFAKSGFEFGIANSGPFSVSEELGLIALNNRDKKKIHYFNLSNRKCISSFNLESYPPVWAIEIINKQEIAFSVFESKSIMTVQFNPRDKNQAKLLSETKGKLEAITSLCYDKHSDHIYAVSSTRHTLNILDRKLSVLHVSSLPCTFPQFLYVTIKYIYILFCGNPCLYIFRKDTYETVRSIIPEGNDLNIEKSNCFAVDIDGSIIIPVRNWINIFSSSGQLLRSFPVNENLDSVSKSISVFVTKDYEIILLTDAPKFPIQIF